MIRMLLKAFHMGRVIKIQFISTFNRSPVMLPNLVPSTLVTYNIFSSPPSILQYNFKHEPEGV